MKQAVYIANFKDQYLGTIYIDQDRNLQVSTANQLLNNLVQEMMKQPVSVTQCQYENKDGKALHILYSKEVKPQDGILYLEGIKNALRNRNFQAYLLEESRAKLLTLMHQSWIAEDVKQNISLYLQDIPKAKIKELIKIFEEEKQGCIKIEQKFAERLKNLKQKHQADLKAMIKREEEELKLKQKLE